MLLEKQKEITLRMRIIGFEQTSHHFHCIHAPILGGADKVLDNKVALHKTNSYDPDKVFTVRMAGVEYPLMERCVKEL